MAQFSGTIKLTDLNDFIAPSQACVVSLQGAAPDAKPPMQLLEEEGKVQLHHKPGTGFKQTVTPGGKDDGPVKVSLHDCLACSGCVTSAETVLLQNQSVGELAAKMMEPGVVVVVTVSPQSRASLAVLHGLDAAGVQARLTTALRRMGVAAVLDIGVGREMALAESAEEFLDRFESSKAASTSSRAAMASTGDSLPALKHPRIAAHPVAAASSAPGPLPVLASACPGWVCYAEKTQGANLLPHISAVKSPQAVMGSIVKRRLAALRGWDPARVYHATVMPCYDKKLEASREDFLLPGTMVPEVDSCLTTGELQQLLEGWDMGNLADVPPTALDTLLPADHLQLCREQQHQQHQLPQQHGQQQHESRQDGPSVGSFSDLGWKQHYAVAPWAEPPLHGAPGSSGGYLEGVVRAAAGRLQISSSGGAAPALPPLGTPLPLKAVRNSDFREFMIEPPAGEGAGTARPLRFAAAYGFRNIQSLVRRIKLGRCEYDYVEVMACPGGCLNGGGQAKPREGLSAAGLLEELERLYYVRDHAAGDAVLGGVCDQGQGTTAAISEVCSSSRSDGCCMNASVLRAPAAWVEADPSRGTVLQQWQPMLSATADALYRDWVGGGPGSAAARKLLHTAYHHRDKTALGTVGDW